MSEFRHRLKQSIEKKGISASELSRISGVGKSDISNYLKGIYVAKQDKCYLLAKALNVDPGWLMTGYEPSNRTDSDLNQMDAVKVLVRGLSKLTPEQLEQATAMFKVMFAPQYAELFTKENDDDT